MLQIPGSKAEHVTEQLTRAGFTADSARRVEYLVPLDAGAIRSLVGMGPSAHHVPDEGTAMTGVPGPNETDTPGTSESLVDVTVSVEVPINSNSWVVPFFFRDRVIASSMTLRKERFANARVP